MAEIIRSNAGLLMSRQDVKTLLDTVRQSAPVVADELETAGVSLGDTQRVLQALLDEGVPIRDLVRILEVLSERARTTKDIEMLSEAARAALGPAVSAPLAREGALEVLTLDPLLEQELVESVRGADGGGTVLALEPTRMEALIVAVAHAVHAAEEQGQQPALACAPRVRAPLRRLVATSAPRLPVLAYGELGSQLNLDTVGVVSIEQPAAV
jgi:flagellar biosynthesis protein FlhA